MTVGSVVGVATGEGLSVTATVPGASVAGWVSGSAGSPPATAFTDGGSTAGPGVPAASRTSPCGMLGDPTTPYVMPTVSRSAMVPTASATRRCRRPGRAGVGIARLDAEAKPRPPFASIAGERVDGRRLTTGGGAPASRRARYEVPTTVPAAGATPVLTGTAACAARPAAASRAASFERALRAACCSRQVRTRRPISPPAIVAMTIPTSSTPTVARFGSSGMNLGRLRTSPRSRMLANAC